MAHIDLRAIVLDGQGIAAGCFRLIRGKRGRGGIYRWFMSPVRMRNCSYWTCVSIIHMYIRAQLYQMKKAYQVREKLKQGFKSALPAKKIDNLRWKPRICKLQKLAVKRWVGLDILTAFHCCGVLNSKRVSILVYTHMYKFQEINHLCLRKCTFPCCLRHCVVSVSTRIPDVIAEALGRRGANIPLQSWYTVPTICIDSWHRSHCYVKYRCIMLPCPL